jgi:hypothetical protein
MTDWKNAPPVYAVDPATCEVVTTALRVVDGKPTTEGGVVHEWVGFHASEADALVELMSVLDGRRAAAIRRWRAIVAAKPTACATAAMEAKR